MPSMSDRVENMNGKEVRLQEGIFHILRPLKGDSFNDNEI